MNLLFYDTETSGLPEYGAKYHESSRNPYLVQIGFIFCPTEGEAECYESLVKPDGFTISAETEGVHGISQERAEREGRPLYEVLDAFLLAVERADVLIAHNEHFDSNLLMAEMHRQGLVRGIDLLREKPRFCTMNSSRYVVNLPPTEKMLAAGFTQPKSPRLEEAYKYFTGKELEGAHDALVDVRGCIAVYKSLVKLGEGYHDK